MSSTDSSLTNPPQGLTEKKYTLNLVKQPLERLSKAAADNVQEIVASQLELMAVYHSEVIDQAKKSFNWALVAAGIGLVFFLGALIFILFWQLQSAALISLVSGALVEFISAINFYLYGKTSAQFAIFQSRLDTTQRFLLANSICEGLDKTAKQTARSTLIGVIAGGNMSIIAGKSNIPDQNMEEK